jgi:hypothetical protein
MTNRKVTPPTVDEYEQRRISMLLSYAPRTYPCKKCGWPVIDGYCCNTCGDSAPYEPAPDAGVKGPGE